MTWGGRGVGASDSCNGGRIILQKGLHLEKLVLCCSVLSRWRRLQGRQWYLERVCLNGSSPNHKVEAAITVRVSQSSSMEGFLLQSRFQPVNSVHAGIWGLSSASSESRKQYLKTKIGGPPTHEVYLPPGSARGWEASSATQKASGRGVDSTKRQWRDAVVLGNGDLILIM